MIVDIHKNYRLVAVFSTAIYVLIVVSWVLAYDSLVSPRYYFAIHGLVIVGIYAFLLLISNFAFKQYCKITLYCFLFHYLLALLLCFAIWPLVLSGLELIYLDDSAAFTPTPGAVAQYAYARHDYYTKYFWGLCFNLIFLNVSYRLAVIFWRESMFRYISLTLSILVALFLPVSITALVSRF